jgi:hypothetical protein
MAMAAKYPITQGKIDFSKIVSFLANNPKTRDVLEAAVRFEEEKEADSASPVKYWEWHNVRAYSATLVKLVISGIIKVAYKSNSGTMYQLVDHEMVKRALKAITA